MSMKRNRDGNVPNMLYSEVNNKSIQVKLCFYQMSRTFQGWLRGPGHKSPHWNGQYTMNTMKSNLVKVDFNNVKQRILTSHIIIIFNWTHLWPDIVVRRKSPSLIMWYCPCQDSLQAGDCDLQNVSRASSICSVNIFSILSPFTSIGEDTWHLTSDHGGAKWHNIKKRISKNYVT